MKKTLITLLALAGVSMGADVTIGSYVTKGGEQFDVVDTFAGETPDAVNKAGYDGLTVDKLHFATLTFSLNTEDMLVSDSSLEKGAVLTLKSLTILGRGDTVDYSAEGSTMTVTVGEESYTSSSPVKTGTGASTYATVTYTFDEPITFKLGDSLSFTFNKYAGEDATDTANNLGCAALKGVSGAPTVFNDVWQIAAQLTVEAPSTPPVPEPATATLSLLALAGLAARRRRK